MADQENCTRLTRAAKKRAVAAAQSQQDLVPATKKKRTVLGELPNFSNVVADPVPDAEPSKRKLRPSKKTERKLLMDVEANTNDPQLCVPYASDIFEYLHSMEIEPKRRPLPDFIEAVQKDVTANMRAILVDWLVEVAEEYKLISDTLYLTVSYIDRFLSLNNLNRQKLQLLGVSCMLIASKYEEISPPHVEDFCYITDNTYTKEEVVKMETDVLKFLNFEMGNPTIKTFTRRFLMAAQENSKQGDLKLEFLVIFITRFTIQPKMHPWNSTLQRCSGYRPSDIKECIQAIHDLQLSRKWGTLAAIRDKYNQHKFKCVAALTSPSDIPSLYFEDIKASH
ncbi:cyclin-A3-4-like isoform X2 [Magnolia sinica]|uniref:cyclin-A3-4-like isoform X2 n=1 Tax=Magnolia sinica TaxID=86752 RepID=UPI002657EA1F|nr:cyclin-A3-4-like isoform X2 [Magnolia sinica]